MERENGELVRAFAGVLMDARRDAGLTQEALSERANVSTRHVSYLETGKRQPTLVILHALCGALGVPMSEFVRRVEQRLNV
jgi:transcriptional regulator with XRE-family HTH domain